MSKKDNIQLVYNFKLRSLSKQEYKTLKHLTRTSKNLYNVILYYQKKSVELINKLNENRKNKLTNIEVLQISQDKFDPRKSQKEMKDEEFIYKCWYNKLIKFSSEKLEENFHSHISAYILDKFINNTNVFLLPAQSVQILTQTIEQNLVSYYKSGNRDKKYPNYLKKDSHFQVGYHTLSAASFKKNKIKIPLSTSDCYNHYSRKHKLSKEIYVDLPTYFLDLKNIVKINQIRIIPRQNAKYFELSIIYTTKKEPKDVNPDEYLSIDIGVNNFASCVPTTGTPFIIDGRKIKSYNQWYDKEISRLKSSLDIQRNKVLNTPRISKKMFQIIDKRNNRIKDSINKSSRCIINYCIENKIGNIIVGYNKGQKQGINIGKSNNQNFVQIPFYKFRNKLKYLCERYGMKYIEQEESYTSKASFLSSDNIPKYKDIPKRGSIERIQMGFNPEQFTNNTYFSGSRITRGQYKDYKYNIIVNADINASCNILNKANKENNLGIPEDKIQQLREILKENSIQKVKIA